VSDEYYSGPRESTNPLTDPPSDFQVVTGGAAQLVAGLNILVNFGADYVDVQLNQNALAPGETLVASVSTEPGPPNLPLSALVGIRGPGGDFYLQPGGGFSPAAVPLASNFILPHIEQLPLFSLPVNSIPGGLVPGALYQVFISFESATRATVAEVSEPFRVLNPIGEREPNGDLVTEDLLFTIQGILDACINNRLGEVDPTFLGTGRISFLGSASPYSEFSDYDGWTFDIVPEGGVHEFVLTAQNAPGKISDYDLYIFRLAEKNCTQQNILDPDTVLNIGCLSGEPNREVCSSNLAGDTRRILFIFPFQDPGKTLVAGDYRLYINRVDDLGRRIPVPVEPIKLSRAEVESALQSAGLK
jgi:hypothetical protein